MSAVTLAGVLSPLSPEKLAGLAKIQPPAVRARIEALTKPATRASSKPMRASDVTHIVQRTECGILVVFKGLKLISAANAHEQHWARKDRVRVEREVVARALVGVAPVLRPKLVRVTRLGVRLMDTDNLAGAAKSVRDEIATWLGVDDGPLGPVTWVVEQAKGEGYGVRVEITGGA